MSYYILGRSKEEYKKRIDRQKEVCFIIFSMAVLANLILCVLRTDSTHIMFLIINIVLDSIVFSFVFFNVSTWILPMKRLYRLAIREKSGIRISGVISGISDSTEMIYGLECYELTVEEENVRKVFVVKNSAFPFELQETVVLCTVDNIVIRAEAQ